MRLFAFKLLRIEKHLNTYNFLFLSIIHLRMNGIFFKDIKWIHKFTIYLIQFHKYENKHQLKLIKKFISKHQKT